MMNEDLFNALCEQIPNLLDCYSKEEVYKIMAEVETNKHDVAEDFMGAVWEEPMRRCDVCGKLMWKGYYLNGTYACDDDCRNAYYKRCHSCETDEDAEREFLYDYIGADEEERERMKELSLAELSEYASECYADTDCYYTEWD